MQYLNIIQKIAVFALPILFAITVHEVAHGWVAKKLGDPTAMMLGRLTLNPLKHIDPVGTVILPLLTLWLGGFIFGWAKPVPVTWENLRHPKRDMALVAIAGPTANLVMILLWAILLKISILLSPSNYWLAQPLILMSGAGVIFNTLLMILNLVPLLPLDGGRVVSGLLPGPLAYQYNKTEPFGLIILMALLFTGMLGYILFPIIITFLNIVSSLFDFGQVLQFVMQILFGHN
ncbi:site-2 protease family protein [Kaarinaea lacus]